MTLRNGRALVYRALCFCVVAASLGAQPSHEGWPVSLFRRRSGRYKKCLVQSSSSWSLIWQLLDPHEVQPCQSFVCDCSVVHGQPAGGKQSLGKDLPSGGSSTLDQMVQK